jgi:hypothetical protein
MPYIRTIEIDPALVHSHTYYYAGIQGENHATEVLVDISEWLTLWPAGVATASFMRPDGNAYAVSVTTSQAGVVAWSPSSSDTEIAGKALLEITLTESGSIVKTRQIPMYIGEDIGIVVPESSINIGDMTYSGAAGTKYLPIGTAGQVLAVNSGATAPEWATLSAADIAVTDTGSFFTTDDVNSALQQLGSHGHGNITAAGAIGTTANLPVWTTTSGLLTTKSVAASQALYTLYNPNLLHHWDFRAPYINQRGSTNYTGTGYCVDRWEITTLAANGYVHVGSANLTIDNFSAADVSVITQIVENGLTRLNGKTVTLSVMVTGGEITSATYTPTLATGVEYAGANFSVMYNAEVVGSADLYMNTSDEVMVRIAAPAAARMHIAAVKLETGGISTLAADPPMDYAKELNTCMRYFEKLGGAADTPVAVGSQYNDVGLVLLNYYPKRAAPVITFAGTHQLQCKSTSTGAHKLFAVTTLETAKATNGLSSAMLQVEATDADNAGEACMLCGAADGSAYIYITADL